MEALERALSRASDVVWGAPLLVLLVGTHLYLTFRLRFIQRYIFKAIRLSFQRTREGVGDVSHFGALTTALAATIGTGNIVGVATAVAAAGPGSVLWMWLTGVFGIATKYAEAVLSVRYRITTPQGLQAGGPMYVLERRMSARWLGLVFAALTAVAAFGIGCMVQANSISAMVEETFRVSPWWTGAVLTVLTGVVILGGIKSIAGVCEKLVPFMAVFYVAGCLVILGLNARGIPETVALIVGSAFTGQAAVGASWGRACGRPSGSASPAGSSRTSPASAAPPSWPPPPRRSTRCGRLSSAPPARSGTRSWYYGEKAAEYLFGARVVAPDRWLWVAAVMVGSVVSLPAVWSFADIGPGTWTATPCRWPAPLSAARRPGRPRPRRPRGRPRGWPPPSGA